MDSGTGPAPRPLHALLGSLGRRTTAGDRDPVARDAAYIERQLPRIELALRYFAPEVRHVERVPKEGPALVVGNHSGYIYMPDAWATAIALARHRGLDASTFIVAHSVLFSVPGVDTFFRRLGGLPVRGRDAEDALRAGAALLVYPGGDWEASRPRSQRNRVDLHGRTGFVRLALRAGVPVVPVVAHGAHHGVVVLARGGRLAKALSLDRMRIHVLPWLAGVPFGVVPVLPPVPLPAKVTIEFLEPLDWSGDRAAAADDAAVVRARYDEMTAVLQAALDRLHAERPHPVLSRLGLAH